MANSIDYTHRSKSSQSSCGNHELCYNILTPRQHGCHFADHIFKFILLYFVLNKISLKFVHRSPIDNESALVQIKALCGHATRQYLNQWHVNLVMHVCVIRPATYKLQWTDFVIIVIVIVIVIIIWVLLLWVLCILALFPDGPVYNTDAIWAVNTPVFTDQFTAVWISKRLLR